MVFSVARGSTRPVRLRLDQVQVCDGRWHDLQLELRDVRSGRETRYIATVRLDFGLYQVHTLTHKYIHPHISGLLTSIMLLTHCYNPVVIHNLEFWNIRS